MLQQAAGSAELGLRTAFYCQIMIATSRLLILAAATCLLPMCANYGRATLQNEPDEGAVSTEPGMRSGSSPEGGSSAPTYGRTALPPEQPRR